MRRWLYLTVSVLTIGGTIGKMTQPTRREGPTRLQSPALAGVLLAPVLAAAGGLDLAHAEEAGATIAAKGTADGVPVCTENLNRMYW